MDDTFKDTIITEKDKVISGPFRKPFNEHLQAATSIHNDATAQQLGMRGGTIAGSYHFEQFAPLFIKVFGRRWFEVGGISMYFRYATTHLEPVQAFMKKPAAAENVQADIWMNDEKGNLVGEGSVTFGQPGEPTPLRQRLKSLRPSGEIRILSYMKPGMDLPVVTARVPVEPTRERISRITEPLDWYVNDSPWGGPILTPAAMTGILRQGEVAFNEGSRGDTVVGLFGGLEYRCVNGPVFCDHDYSLHTKILAVGDTPQTEFYWYESALNEPGGGKRVAEALHMIRVMKASSPLYPELRSGS